eukprot:CAMPEP_0118653956 /NCGR_PEP_ID=MMETSP0785-20121206/12109_1 /TAXON_ID=91992 /ORGANISM="Bolidomonas pacifica, Strain CCMP 1866" /LENGTH=294 /DNA_ID=CAMNT_0006546537 /DNA_START=90 /DNA_END=971 /DNA_ORIENTATION=+
MLRPLFTSPLNPLRSLHHHRIIGNRKLSLKTSRSTNQSTNRSTPPSRNVDINYRIIGYGRKRDYQGLKQYALDNWESFNDVNWSTFYSNLRRHPQTLTCPLFLTLHSKFESLLSPPNGVSWMNPQAISNTVHALGALNLLSLPLLNSVDASSQTLTSQFTPQDISIVLHGMARVNYKPRSMTVELSRPSVAERILVDVKGRDRVFANVIWSAAKLNLNLPSFVSAINDDQTLVGTVVGSGDAVTISRVVWSLSVLGCRAEGLVERVDERWVVSKLLESGSTQAVSNVMYGVAKM